MGGFQIALFFIVCLSVSSQDTAVKCPADKPRAECLVNPCTVSSCPGYKNATCQPDYCGGCFTKWFVNYKQVTCQAPNCTTVKCASPDCPGKYRPTGSCCDVCPDCNGIACPKCAGTTLPGACCPTCGLGGVACTDDVQQCPDGSFVGRDENCNFRPCPAITDCPKNKPKVSCFVDPCQSTCPGHPNAVCQADYCGGCFAHWFENGKEIKCDAPNCTAVLCALVECAGKYRPTNSCCDICPICPKIACTKPSCDNPTTPAGGCCPSCSGGGKACPEDAKLCPDGSSVGRDPDNNCAFRPCPTTCPKDKPQVQCFIDPCSIAKCPGHDKATCQADYCGGCFTRWFEKGKEIKCDAPNCTTVKCASPDCPGKYRPTGSCCDVCPACPKIACPAVIGCDKPTTPPGACCPSCTGGLKVCTADAFLCPDGSSVGRDFNNNCKFFPCPVVCPKNNPAVPCFANPCTVSKCPGHPNATCQPDYCGGCNTHWFEKGKEIKCDAPACAGIECPMMKCKYGSYKPAGECCATCYDCSAVTCPALSCAEADTTTLPGVCCPICNKNSTVCAPEVGVCDYSTKIVERDPKKKCEFPCSVSCKSTPKNCGIVPPCFAGKTCQGHPDAVCKTSVCDPCAEYWFENGKQVKCGATGYLLTRQEKYKQKLE